MRLTVLGNAGQYLAPLSGGSGYLLETGEARILLDCGGGVRDALARLPIERLDAVVLSHFHFDHVLDFVTIRDLLDARTTVILPEGERARLDALGHAYAFEGAFDLPGRLVEARPDAPLRIGGARLTFARTQHSAPSFATRIEHAGRALAYASDTAPCAPLADLARDADLLLMHALLPTVEPDAAHARIHATAETAAALAVAAGAMRLVLSHRYWESPDAAMVEAARAHPAVALARRGATLEA